MLESVGHDASLQAISFRDTAPHFLERLLNTALHTLRPHAVSMRDASAPAACVGLDQGENTTDHVRAGQLQKLVH